MQFPETRSRFAPRLVDALYVEAMVLADEARSYFDRPEVIERDALTPLARVVLACESLRVTTRLMHVVAWLLTRRAIENREIATDPERAAARRLGHAEESDPEVWASLPEAARAVIVASHELYARVRRLEGEIDRGEAMASPARGLINRLERAF